VNRRTGAIGGGLALLAVVVVVGVGLTRSGGPSEPAVPRFVDETAASGLVQSYGGDDTFDVGGGVAVFDCDGDNRPDIFAAGGGRPSGLYRNVSTTGGPLRFVPVPGAASDLTDVTGAYPIDIDGDGIADLVALRDGVSEVLRGLGGCRFESANAAWHLEQTPATTTAFSATWEAGATRPTLAFGTYVASALADGRYVCPDDQLFRPSPDDATYEPPVALHPGYCTLSMLFSDWARSGHQDLRISNDRQYYDNDVGGEQLWQIEPGQPPHPYGDADGWALLRLWGMGIASYDVTGDGYPDVYLTSQGANTLQTLARGPAQPAYHDIALKLGIEATRPAAGGDPLPSTAWHPEFQDVNNDGLVDLFISKGNVDQIPDYAARDPSDLFLGKADGSFTDAAEAAGIVSFDRGRGAALADFNDDGLLDLVEVFLDAPTRLWRNVGTGTADAPQPMGSWLAVRVQQPGTNRDAIGGWLEVRVGQAITRRELTIGGGHLGGQLGWIHVGLGAAGTADVRVQWPDGEVGPWLPATADQFIEIDRGNPAVQPLTLSQEPVP
jgi:hypothetical protein